MPKLRRSVIYGDANDYNVLVSDPWPQPREAVAVIDFGDMHHGLTISEPAIAAAYAILAKRKTDLLPAAAAVISGYHSAYPLQELDLEVLYALIGMRLAVSVVNSAYRKTLKPDDAYVTVTEAPAWDALERLATIHPRFAHYTFRDACGLSAVPQTHAVQRRLKNSAPVAVSVLPIDLRTAPIRVFDLSAGSMFLGADPARAELSAMTDAIFADMRRCGSAVGIGRYNEARLIYTSPLFAANDQTVDRTISDQTVDDLPTDERRTLHLGMDFFVDPGAPVCAPLDGIVHSLANVCW